MQSGGGPRTDIVIAQCLIWVYTVCSDLFVRIFSINAVYYMCFDLNDDPINNYIGGLIRL